MNAAAHDAQELAVAVRLHRQALVRREDADAVEFACLHENGVLVRVEVCLVTDVTIV